MRLDFSHVEIDASDGDALSVSAFESSDWPTGSRWQWSVVNAGDDPVTVGSISLVFRLFDPAGPVRMFRNGYQSWGDSGVVTLGVDEDLSRVPQALDVPLIRAAYNADQTISPPGELRSELVTALTDGFAPVLLLGFDGGDRHDGTLRLRPGEDPELRAEAFLGGAVLAPGEERELHGVVTTTGDDATPLLEGWAQEVGRRNQARVAAPYQVGWCSWYHYFHDLTEADVRSNLALAADWPFDVFQIDDAYQSAIGDWLTTNERFPSTLDQLSAAIAAEGRTPGLWIAPFIAAPDSRVATDHPDWLARQVEGDGYLPGMFNPPWGGGMGGVMWALDTTHPEVQAHLEDLGRSLREAGYPYLKLDFTYAPSFEGRWHDPSKTPAQRVRLGYDAVRRGAGDDAFLLGCGAPLGPVIGVVDGNRIGPDVDPRWEVDPTRDDLGIMAGYVGSLPATKHGWRNTLARSFMHRTLWLNDPDCLMLRTDKTEMTPAMVEAWAHAVAVSGGMALVSDDLSLLGSDCRRLLDEVVAIGRQADAEALRGLPARCPDLMDHPVPHRLEAAGYHLDGDPDAGTATLTPPA